MVLFPFYLPVFVKFILECFDSILIHLSQIIHDNFPFLFKCFSNCWLLWDDFHYVNHFLYAVSQGCKILIQFRAPTCCNRWSNFQSSSESSQGIHCFYYISLYNWFQKSRTTLPTNQMQNYNHRSSTTHISRALNVLNQIQKLSKRPIRPKQNITRGQ